MNPRSDRSRDAVLRSMFRVAARGGARAPLAIVIFHRVLPLVDELFPGEVTAERFHAVCTWLSRWFNVLPLDEGVERMRAGALPPRALAITFDDGYADNHDVALPILQRAGLPATFFIATGFLNGGRMWNDTVIEALRRCDCGSLDLRDLGIAGVGILSLRDAPARRLAIDQLVAAIKHLDPAERQVRANEIAAVVGAPLPSDLMMRSEQVAALRRAGMQIGAHTVSHPILASIDESRSHAEIARSKSDLESLLNEKVTLFAYPNGRPGRDYAARDVEIVRSLGFAGAVSTSWGTQRSGESVDTFQLPRFTPWRHDAWSFGLQLLRNLYTPILRV